MSVMDLRGLSPAPVTVFTRDGEVDYAANARLAKWLVSIQGVKSLVILGHAGEGTFLTTEERLKLIETYVEAVGGDVPIIAGITGEGTRVAAGQAFGEIGSGFRGHRHAAILRDRKILLRNPLRRSPGSSNIRPLATRTALQTQQRQGLRGRWGLELAGFASAGRQKKVLRNLLTKR